MCCCRLFLNAGKCNAWRRRARSGCTYIVRPSVYRMYHRVSSMYREKRRFDVNDTKVIGTSVSTASRLTDRLPAGWPIDCLPADRSTACRLTDRLPAGWPIDRPIVLPFLSFLHCLSIYHRLLFCLALLAERHFRTGFYASMAAKLQWTFWCQHNWVSQSRTVCVQAAALQALLLNCLWRRLFVSY